MCTIRSLWQLADIPKTAVITPFGLFEFLRMPFGLKNAAQAFQRLIDQVCRGLEEFLFVYLDDILVASSKPTEHLHHAKALSEFLGMVNFYHRFVPHAAALMGPLHGMSHAKDRDFQWSPSLQTAFDMTKQALASATLLVHPSATATTCLTVDASDLAVGGVLEYFLEGSWKPLAFFSRKLDKAQKSYSAFDRELLAMLSLSILRMCVMFMGATMQLRMPSPVWSSVTYLCVRLQVYLFSMARAQQTDAGVQAYRTAIT